MDAVDPGHGALVPEQRMLVMSHESMELPPWASWVVKVPQAAFSLERISALPDQAWLYDLVGRAHATNAELRVGMSPTPMLGSWIFFGSAGTAMLRDGFEALGEGQLAKWRRDNEVRADAIWPVRQAPTEGLVL